ncbi:MAG: hypothetical protein JWP28_2613 [Phenylobacterium sp.]|jgi:hypothetical protein|uniref:hypothetical protein n=1 Tax=Phenylobacterium sp. TaxID=1871053 RepID=UPI00262FDA9C|nr:hypothetical protein [Phenylobacterium sp.]MDB5428539.1 hypothetical protein [Phenylobacterium sp.]MDB5464792.1 hypothetical protein [Phenylobacterium sp.]MDB5498582.1 hypothetical protein [Phenylobacterium sp.]
MSTRKSIRLLGYASLGPITGPLVAGVIRNMTKRQPVLASLYALTIAVVWLDIWILGRWSLPAIGRFLQ